MNVSATNSFSSSDNLKSFFGEGALLSVPHGAVNVAYGGFERVSSSQKDRHSLFAPDFHLRDVKPWWIPQFVTAVNHQDLRTFLDLKNVAVIDEIVWKNPELNLFKQDFFTLQKLIREDRLKKGVPYTKISTENWQASQMLPSMLAAITEQSALWGFGLWDQTEGILGATPEVLCRYDKRTRRLQTMALAGTAPLENFQAGDLLKNKKIQLEHALVIESLKTELKAWGEVTVSSTREVRAHRLMHLQTDILVSCQLEIELEAVVRALHPTPALGTYPRNQSGQDWLQSCDSGQDRARFGAPFGWLFPNGDFLVLVAIRHIQWQKNCAQIFAGCGVIAESQLEAEWNEILHKLASVRKMLAL